MRHNGTILTTTAANIPLYAGSIYLDSITIHTALVGTLTITGMLNNAGAATNWVLPIGSVGRILAEGRIPMTSPVLNLSSASDTNKVLVGWEVIA